jgi:hypothetical protein
MTGSWREILSSAAENEAEAWEGERPGAAFHCEEEEQLQAAGGRKFDDPELNAFLTRLASQPDVAVAPVERAAPSRRQAAGPREKAVRDAVARADADKSAEARSLPVPRRGSHRYIATPLLAAAACLSAYALFPSGGTPETGLKPAVIETSRVRPETASPARVSRMFKARHKRMAAGRTEAERYCANNQDDPSCRWRRLRD